MIFLKINCPNFSRLPPYEPYRFQCHWSSVGGFGINAVILNICNAVLPYDTCKQIMSFQRRFACAKPVYWLGELNKLELFKLNVDNFWCNWCSMGLMLCSSDIISFLPTHVFYMYRVPTHPWKYLNLFILNSRPWKYLKTGQVLESPWILFHRSLKVIGFIKSNTAIWATF